LAGKLSLLYYANLKHLIMKPKVKYLLFILPLVFLFVCLVIPRPKYQNDPEYSYLLNAVNNANLWAAGHIDHPGTTLQVGGAIILRWFHLNDITTTDDLQTSVLKNPDKYSGLLCTCLIILNFLILIFSGLLVYHYSKNIWLTLIIQLTPFYSGIWIEHISTKMSPEQLLAIAGILFPVLIIRYFYNPDSSMKRTIILFSIVTGFGVATKINFLPLALIPLIIIPSFRNKMYFIFGSIISFVIFTLPIINQYGTFYHWIVGIITHKGLFGQGESGFTDIGTYIQNIKEILKASPYFTVTFFLSVLSVLIFFQFNLFLKKKFTLNLKIISAIIIAQIFNILIVAKHMKVYYIFPSLCLSGANLFFIILTIKQFSEEIKTNFKYQVQVLSIVVFIITAIYAIPVSSQLYKNYKLNRTEHDYCKYLISNNYADYKIVYTLPFSYNKFSGYMLSKDYDNLRHLPLLKYLYPDTYLWDTRWNQFYNWDTKVSYRDLYFRDKNKVILYGAPFDEATYNSFKDLEFKLNPVFKGTSYIIYDMVPIEVIPHNFEFFCDAENLANGDKDFKTTIDRITLGNGNTRSEERSHSGKYSIRLNQNSQFGMTYRINDAKKGDSICISVWRFPADKKGQIVVSGLDSKEFYKAGCYVINTDQNGWQEIELKFQLEADIKENTLDIYLWNESKNDIYFDDYKLIRK
jgi:hypothetical protein